MNKEMMRALEADGEKLRQLTGEDHGPWDPDDLWRCDVCGADTRPGYLVCVQCNPKDGLK